MGFMVIFSHLVGILNVALLLSLIVHDLEFRHSANAFGNFFMRLKMVNKEQRILVNREILLVISY